MKIDEQELLKFFKTYKKEIFDDVDFNNHYIESVILNGVVDGKIESIVNIHSLEPDTISDFKINGMNVSMNYHMVMTPITPIKDFIVFLRKRKINKIISSV